MKNEGELVRSGTWLYDGSVVSHVRIWKVRADWTAEEATELDDDGERVHPETDADGFYYVSEFNIAPFNTAGGGASRTLAEAISHAERLLKQGITWSDA